MTSTTRPTCYLPWCRETVPPGMLVCGQCTDALALRLLMLPTLALALEEAHRKALRFSVGRPGRLHGRPGEDFEEESPVPFNPRASEVLEQLVTALAQWADLIAAERGLFRPSNTAAALGPWLARQVSWLRSWPRGPEAVELMTAAIGAAERIVDRPPDLRYAGPCGTTVTDDDGLATECVEDVYAQPGQPVGVCRGCGARWPMAERRSWLLSQVEDMLLPATELARAIDGLGVYVTPSMIRNWQARGHLVQHGSCYATIQDGRRREVPLYRVGDVLDKVNADRIRREAKGQQRAGA